MLKLVGTDGKKFYSWALRPGKYIIGRNPGADFTIPNKTVSSRHAEIEIIAEAGKYLLTDLGSKNGTAVNGCRIEAETSIKIGDNILFGQAEFKLAEGEEDQISSPGSPAMIYGDDLPQNSVFIPLEETFRPLPQKVTDLPELWPTLFDMAKMLVVTDPKEMMLEKSLRLIAKIIPAERLLVLFVSDDQENVYTAASLLPGDNDPGKISLSRTIIREIITNKNSILISDPLADPRFAEKESIIMSEMKSAMAVPLFDEGKVLGILYADTSNPLHRYSDEYLRVLATFGNIIASRLLNYSLMEERQSKQILDAELDKAASIQKGLLVKTPPEFPGFQVQAFQEQSRSVGGDLYDLKVLPDGRLLIIVADVSGKGMGAALLMANVLAAFRILYEGESFNLVEVVRNVSMQLLTYSTSGNFVTLFIGLVDPRDSSMSYVNAGHNPPLVVTKDGGLELLEATGMMIGAFDFATWEEKKINLSDGDMVFIFTDGVTEADRNGQGDQFGDERLEKLAVEMRGYTPKEITTRLMDEINAFMGDAPRSDDITTLIIKRVIS
jgi:sigma-B regulation protein RsbU (phosphoserine phosphatase)